MVRNKNTCIQITKKGERCKKIKWKNSKYCYIHSIGKREKMKLIHNPLFHLAITIIFSILIAVFIFFLSPSKSKQERILASQEEQSEDLKDIKSFLSNRMSQLTKELDSALLSGYPTGYNLVGHGVNKIIIPNESIL